MRHCFSFTATDKDGNVRGNSRHCRDRDHADTLVDAWNAGTETPPKGHEEGTRYAFIGFNGKMEARPERDSDNGRYGVYAGSYRATCGLSRAYGTAYHYFGRW